MKQALAQRYGITASSPFGVLVVWMTEIDVCVGNLQRGYGVADEGATKPKDTKKLSLLQKINRHATTALGEIERYSLPSPIVMAFTSKKMVSSPAAQGK